MTLSATMVPERVKGLYRPCLLLMDTDCTRYSETAKGRTESSERSRLRTANTNHLPHIPRATLWHHQVKLALIHKSTIFVTY